MKNARVNGVELEYEVTGSGEPVLLISPVLADAFRPLLSERELADHYQLITYHKRGWLGSTHPQGPVSVADHAADAAALLDHLGIRRAHVAGHGSGAAVAVELALRRPELVRTVSLLELSLLSVPTAAAFFEKAGPAFGAYASGDREQALATFMSAVSGLEWQVCRKLLERHVPGVVAQALQDADTFFEIELPALQEWTFGAAQAAAISQPILSVNGAETGPMWIETAGLLRAWAPKVEQCTIDGAGHLLQLQQPAAVAQGIARFLDRH